MPKRAEPDAFQDAPITEEITAAAAMVEQAYDQLGSSLAELRAAIAAKQEERRA